MAEHWKIVRDFNKKWCQEHGVSGSWRTSPNPVRGLARKLIEESGEFGEELDPGELFDLRDVLNELIALCDPVRVYEDAHRDKTAVFGEFSDHMEWTPVPGLDD